MILRSLELRLPTRRELNGVLVGARSEGTGSRPWAFDIAFDRFCLGYARPQSEGLGTAGHAECPQIGTGSLPNT